MKVKLSGFRLFTSCISIVLILAILLVSGGCGFKSEFEYESDWDDPPVTKPLDPTPYLSDDRDEAWRNDLKYMEDNLRAFHGDLFYEMSEQDFDTAVSKLHDDYGILG